MRVSPARPRYRGKYPSRIRSVGTLTGRPGVLHLVTNDGRAFEAPARSLEVAGIPFSVGFELPDIARPFRKGFSRTVAALARIDSRSDQTVPTDCATGRECAQGLELAIDHSGGEDWSAVAGDAIRLLKAMLARFPSARQRAYRLLRSRGFLASHALNHVREFGAWRSTTVVQALESMDAGERDARAVTVGMLFHECQKSRPASRGCYISGWLSHLPGVVSDRDGRIVSLTRAVPCKPFAAWRAIYSVEPGRWRVVCNEFGAPMIYATEWSARHAAERVASRGLIA